MHDPKAKPVLGRRFLLLPSSQRPEQQKLMVLALILLIAALGMVLYTNRDFWFPETEEATDQPVQRPASVGSTPAIATSASSAHQKTHPSLQRAITSPVPPDDPLPPTSVTRTVLPPLEVEVIAGSTHQSVRPGANSVNVDLQQDDPPVKAATPIVKQEVVSANIATNASERSEISPAPDVVSHAVQPGYPLLARQMKVQGAVTLVALVGRDGLIQNLSVVSGPPILATAAREAVKQWHFKPHYTAGQAVETEARITVNFTISTN